MSLQKPCRHWLLIPIVGSFAFLILYIVSAFLYPGGSGIDKTSAGFSWINNYWCNLLAKDAINGQPNTGQPFAIAAMLIIIISISFFWFAFPILTGQKKYYRIIIQISGITGMLSSFLLLSDLEHDLIINTSSLLGCIATIGVIVALYRLKWYKLFLFGIFNILLVALNNYFYHAKEMITYLPIVQKISFISFLAWFCFICTTSCRNFRQVVIQ